MTTQKESKISSAIMKQLRSEGYFCFKVHGSALMMAGLCDIIACVEGYFVGIETKTPDKRNNVSEVQQHVHTQIRRASGIVLVVCGPKEASMKIAELKAKWRES